jgi:hypothetical protein
MLTRLRPGKPSPALVISCIALFVALSGSSYAVIVLPKNSVGTKQLKKNAVTSAKVKNNALTGADVNEATLVLPPAANTAGLEQAVQGLQARVAELERKLAAVSYDDAAKLFRFNGVNVQVVDGTGDTEDTPNGLGNLIVGYNESNGDTRTGSHNLVVGQFHTYSSFGGLIAGYNNSVTGTTATVSGGRQNTASGSYASVSGGQLNTASGSLASVSGGEENTASGSFASVSGGEENTSGAGGAWVSGGLRNTATGLRASVSGGKENTASGSQASVSGGQLNTASGSYASVSGGGANTASGFEQWLAGTLNIRTATVPVPGAGSVEGNGAYFTRAVSQVCSAGELLLSGGGYWQPVTDVNDDDEELPLNHSRVLDAKDGWSIRGGNDTNIDRTLVVQALCLGP